LAYEYKYQEPSDADESSEGDAPEPPGPSRKRVADPQKWKRNARKTKAVAEKAPCSCSLRCYHKIGRSSRKQIRARFQALTRPERKHHMRGHIDLKKVIWKGKAIQIRRRRPRRFTATYHLTPRGAERVQVCNNAFLAILGVGATQVKNLNKQVWNHPDAPISRDGRGMHGQQAQVPLDVVARVDAHIKAFPRKASHYALGGKRYLSAELSAKQMWRLYLARYEPNVWASMQQHARDDDGDEEEDEEEDEQEDDVLQPVVVYQKYLERFNTMDLGFGKPPVDSCATCDRLKTALKACEDEEEAEALKTEKREHLVAADRFYKTRRHDQGLAETTRAQDADWHVPNEEGHRAADGVEFISSDMAGVLSTPKLTVGPSFYLRKLRTFCYGIWSAQANQHTLAFWSEREAKNGSNEVLSAMHQHFVTRRTGSTHAIWSADNTSAQAKNKNVILYCSELVRPHGFHFFDRLDQKFPEVGHSFMENDRAFGALSQKAKKKKVIASPKQWMKLARRCKRPPFHAMWMEQDRFRNWDSYLGQLYRTPGGKKQWINTAGDAVSITKVRWFNFGVGEDRHGKLVRHANPWYRYSLDPTEPWKQIKLVRRQIALNIDGVAYMPNHTNCTPRRLLIWPR
jgi:hypothetical protein